ncbi:MAG TPA: lipoyl synthase [Candidatus Acetothermia bacterium]|nr:lipoyl synthase [Candidatus Acetothermia bacterium]
MAEKPDWLRVFVPTSSLPSARHVDRALSGFGIHTVCRSARCPNLPTCWGQGAVTFMILGDVCTRSCRFCAVEHGRPAPRDPGEPFRLAQVVRELGLRYVVLTSVDRDDLPDGGAGHYAAAIRLLRQTAPQAIVEALIPDFGGERGALDAVVGAGPHVVGHNLETVRRLTPAIRDRRAGYDLSLSVLRAVKEIAPRAVTKSSLLLGLGETEEEVGEALADLRAAEVDVVVLGQYLRPTARQLPVVRYVPPPEFCRWAQRARELGFRGVVAEPLARASFRAAEIYAGLR